MTKGEYSQSGVLATISQQQSPISAETVTIFAQGGVAVATILSVTYLVRWLVRLVEVSRNTDND